MGWRCWVLHRLPLPLAVHRSGPACCWAVTPRHGSWPGPLCVQRLKGEVDLENYENIPVPKPKQLPDDDDD